MAKDPTKETELQAILIADNFDKRFAPLAISWSLMPFCGSTFLDYALEFLSFTDVKEVFIVTSKQNDLVKNHVKKNWSRNDLGFKITIFSSADYRSYGDAMRDVDKKGVIKSDFILLQAGVICNSNLKEAIQEHKNRRLKDKNSVMTLVYTDCSPNHSSRPRNRDIFVAVQNTTKRLLYLQNVTDSTALFNVPLDVFMQYENVSTKFNLLDCNIAICSPQIPPLFSDNFDFETRRDVIKEILTNDEILGYQMHVHFLQNKNAGFVGDYHSYVKISQLTMERYFAPLIPDLLMLDNDEAEYVCSKRNVYFHKSNIKLAKTAKFIKNVVVGRDCQINDNALIENSIIGDNCIIGAGTVIKNSILWNNICIGSSCSVQYSLLCSNVKLSDSVVINERCILLNDVTLKCNAAIECGSLLSHSNKILEDICFTELPSELTSEKTFNIKMAADKKKPSSIWPEWFDWNIVDIVEDDVDTEDEPGSGPDDPDDPYGDAESFYFVVLEILQRGFEEKIDCANLILEINCAKPTYNIGLDELNSMLTKALLEVAKLKNCLNNLRPMLQHFLPLLKNYFKTTKSQLNLLEVFSTYSTSNKDFVKNLKNVLYFLYENDVLSEEAILNWHSNLDSSLAKALTDFIEWLKQSDEETSEEEN